MKKALHFLIIACALFSAPCVWAAVVTLDIKDVIQPIVSEYVVKGISQAETEKAAAVVIRLSTPGGLDQSMREIIEKILSSKVPVIAFVAPSGARAASAGFFILLSADLALMAPGTNTGAAHPVSVTGGKIDDVMAKKIENDAAAYIRSFVTKRGRNYQLAEKGVTESKSFTEAEAVSGHLIDGIAKDLDDVVTRFDGKEIRRFNGEKQVLKLKGEILQEYRMSLRQRVLSQVLNPNIALILGMVGLLALYIEFTNPGLILPGVLGAICLFLAMVAFNILPVNLVGVALIIAAVGLFILEAKVASHGILAALGIAAMVFGSLILVDSPLPEMRVHLGTAVGVTLPFAGISIFLLRLVILSRKTKSVAGMDGMIGKVGVALSDIENRDAEGKVQVHGEIWQAQSSEPVRTGEKVRVLAVEGLKITVAKV